MKTELLKKLIPAAAMTMFASVAFAGVPQIPTSSGTADQVSQTEPTPEFCKKNPTDPRCDKK
jgi:hypothetical protein